MDGFGEDWIRLGRLRKKEDRGRGGCAGGRQVELRLDVNMKQKGSGKVKELAERSVEGGREGDLREEKEISMEGMAARRF